MLVLVLYFLACFGLSYVVGKSRISLPFREMFGGVPVAEPLSEIEKTARRKSGFDPHWEVKPIIPVIGPFLIELVECPACLGVWIGFLIGWFIPLPVDAVWLFSTKLSSALLLAFATSGSNLVLAKITKIV